MSNETTDQSRTWAMLCHLIALAGCIPFANIIGPLVVWQLKRKESPFIDDQGKESLNFQITMTILGFAIIIVSFLIPPLYLLLYVLGLADLILIVMASIKAKDGVAYRYPFALRLIS